MRQGNGPVFSVWWVIGDDDLILLGLGLKDQSNSIICDTWNLNLLTLALEYN